MSLPAKVLGILLLGSLAAASVIIGQDESPENTSSPKLVLKTDDVFVHFVPPGPVPPQRAGREIMEVARSTEYRNGQLVLTHRDDGAMFQLIDTGGYALPTRSRRFVETRIAGAGIEDDRLYVLTWVIQTSGRPLPADTEIPPPADDTAGPRVNVRRVVSVFDLADGRRVAEADLDRNVELQLTDEPSVRFGDAPVAARPEAIAAMKRLAAESAAEEDVSNEDEVK